MSQIGDSSVSLVVSVSSPGATSSGRKGREPRKRLDNEHLDGSNGGEAAQGVELSSGA